MSFSLDTPEEINMWVLLSRRAQVKMHMRGMEVPGLMSWIRSNIEGAESIRTVREGIVPLEYAIVSAGGPQDFTFVNVHVMVETMQGIYKDMGIVADMGAVETNPDWVTYYQQGRLELVYTLDDVRPANDEIFVPA